MCSSQPKATSTGGSMAASASLTAQGLAAVVWESVRALRDRRGARFVAELETAVALERIAAVGQERPPVLDLVRDTYEAAVRTDWVTEEARTLSRTRCGISKIARGSSLSAVESTESPPRDAVRERQGRRSTKPLEDGRPTSTAVRSPPDGRPHGDGGPPASQAQTEERFAGGPRSPQAARSAASRSASFTTAAPTHRSAAP